MVGVEGGPTIVKNPLFIADEEGFPDVVKTLSEEKDNWKFS